jgi:hypothetical protein
MWPHQAIELLFFAIFGQTTHENFKIVPRDKQEPWTTAFFKLAFGIYMLVSVVVLINLLIAMMSDTYQRIQAQSDIEWKYGLSKLIRNMHRCESLNIRNSSMTSGLSVMPSFYNSRSLGRQFFAQRHTMPWAIPLVNPHFQPNSPTIIIT